MNESLQSGASFAELNRQLLAGLTQIFLLALIIVGATTVILILLSGRDALRARREQALIQKRLQELAAARVACSRPPVETHTFNAPPALASARHARVWRFQVRRWTLALSIDQIEKPV